MYTCEKCGRYSFICVRSDCKACLPDRRGMTDAELTAACPIAPSPIPAEGRESERLRCCGRWLKGSGGHAVFSQDCPVPVEWSDGAWHFCDAHLPRMGGRIHPSCRDVERVPSTSAPPVTVDPAALARMAEAVHLAADLLKNNRYGDVADELESAFAELTKGKR